MALVTAGVALHDRRCRGSSLRLVTARRGAEREPRYVHPVTDAATTFPVTIVPANEASWEDLQAVLGTRGDPHRCQYPMLTQPGQEIAWGEHHVGSRSIFTAAGLAEVSPPDSPKDRDAHRLRATVPPDPERTRTISGSSCL